MWRLQAQKGVLRWLFVRISIICRAIDGAAAILVGISSNIAMQTGQMVTVSDLFPLPERTAQPNLTNLPWHL